MNQADNRNVLDEWRESAPYWEKRARTIREMFAPITGALIEQAGIGRGFSVLDVAGGTGEPSLTIAERVGRTGSVICTDAVLEMMAAASRAASARKLTGIEVCQCLADSLPFADGCFNVAVSRLGAMFFPDAVKALREMLRVVAPGGRVSLAVWADREFNPFFQVVTDILSRYVQSPPEDPDAPGAFRFAEPGKLARLLDEAGAIDINETSFNFRIQAELSPSEFWNLRAEISDTLRQKLALLNSEQVTRLGLEVEREVSRFFLNDSMNFPAQVLIVTGSKSL